MTVAASMTISFRVKGVSVCTNRRGDKRTLNAYGNVPEPPFGTALTPSTNTYYAGGRVSSRRENRTVSARVGCPVRQFW